MGVKTVSTSWNKGYNHYAYQMPDEALEKELRIWTKDTRTYEILLEEWEYRKAKRSLIEVDQVTLNFKMQESNY